MKPGAVLLNFSRNELAVNADVLAALESGQLGGYVVDFPSADLLGMEKVVAIPHLGASTPESEENCASMAAAQLRDYIEFGSIHNSVNLPEVPLGRPEEARVLIIHENIPNTIATITTCVSMEGINITNLTNKSRKDMAVTVIDVPELPSDQAIANIKRLPGVIRVRTFA
jgi:D-3-phosphoglycerate dehydrogenase